MFSAKNAHLREEKSTLRCQKPNGITFQGSRVEGWRGAFWSVSRPRLVNPACGFPAHGFPMFFTARHAPSSNLLSRGPCRVHTFRTDPGGETGYIPTPDL